VIVNCPPGCKPSKITTSRFALLAYKAAVNPAGPDPIMAMVL